MPKRIKSDRGGAFVSKEKKICKSQNITCECGTANLHSGLVERTIQTMKNLILAKLEDNTSLRENENSTPRTKIHHTLRNQENTV